MTSLAGDQTEQLPQQDRDFPYYDGKPVSLTGRQWLLIMLGVAIGLFVLVLTPTYGVILPFIGAILFSVIPLWTLHTVAGSSWSALFHRPHRRDFLWAFAIALLNIAVSFAVGLALSTTFGANPNGIFREIGRLDGVGLALLYLRTGIQLFGEEVFSILPFLAMLWFFHARLGWRRGPAILLAWIGCALWFGAAHLPTYGWNVVQAFSIIGLARVVLLIAYLKTKNLFASFGAHVLTDWTYFSLPLILAVSPIHGT